MSVKYRIYEGTTFTWIYENLEERGCFNRYMARQITKTKTLHKYNTFKSPNNIILL
jgi:hypothetical protein